MIINKNKKGISKITIYKIESSFPIKRALKEYIEPTNGNGDLNGWNYRIFIRSKTNILPAWKPLIDDIMEETEIPRNAYASLVILFNKGNSYFALTAGYGYANVCNYAISDFGIDIACKALDPNQLSNLSQKIPTGNVFGLNRTLRGKYIPTNDSTNKRSVLKALKGKTINDEVGVSLEGRKSLAISGKKAFQDVVTVLDKIIKLEKSQKITVDIKGLDEVEKELSKILDQKLIDNINAGKFDDVLFGYDDDLIFNNCEYLKVGKHDILFSIDDIQDVMEAAQLWRPKDSAFIKVIGYDEQNQEIFGKKLIDLIEGELDFENNKYFRIDKKWYKTNKEYKKQIENDFKSIEKIKSGYFKPWQKKNGKFVSEDDFLKENIDSNKILAHMKKISHVEIADIIDKNKCYFIHVKKGRGAFLRNLFAQGYVSGSLFRGDEQFKKLAKDKFTIDINKKFTIVFAIFPEDETNIDSIFTLFAKVDLLERLDSLKNFGFDVKYCLIENS
jgi:uncharacterized protein (TIGR04141 family)